MKLPEANGGPDHVVLEIDATQFLDVIHKYVIQGPQSTINIAMGSMILCAKAQSDATIAIWARRPIDEETPLCEIGVWVFATGQPMPKQGLTYLDTVIIVQAPALVAPGATPRILVWHAFLLTDSLMAGNVTVSRG